MRTCGLAIVAVAFCGCNSINGSMNNRVPGMWNYSQGSCSAAREEFYRAVADDPQNATFKYNLACAMRRRGISPGAEQTYRLSLQTDPSHQPSYHALAALVLRGSAREANQLIVTWADTQPNNPFAQVEMAWIQRENGDAAGAEQSLYRSLAANPDTRRHCPARPTLSGHGANQPGPAMFQRSYQGEWLEPQVPRLSEVPARLPAMAVALHVRLECANHSVSDGQSDSVGTPPPMNDDPATPSIECSSRCPRSGLSSTGRTRTGQPQQIAIRGRRASRRPARARERPASASAPARPRLEDCGPVTLRGLA